METISARELERYAREGKYLIIDLRSREEFRKKHVRGAVNVPQGHFEKEPAAGKDATIILYCDRGALSMAVARDLERKGYHTKSVVGGFRAYCEQISSMPVNTTGK